MSNGAHCKLLKVSTIIIGLLTVRSALGGGQEVHLQPLRQGSWRLHCQSENISVFASYKHQNVFSGAGGPGQLVRYEFIGGTKKDGVLFDSNKDRCALLLDPSAGIPVHIDFGKSGGPKAIAKTRGGNVELSALLPDGSRLTEKGTCTVELDPVAELFL